MKKLFIALIAIATISSAFVFVNKENSYVQGDETGIDFSKLSLEEAKTEAKKSGKIIFIDAYTEWCGPCKKMAATSFKDEKVAKLFNEKFVNIKVEMEKSDDGPFVARTYGVKAYPTLLFIDKDGKVKQSVIGFQTADQLLAVGKSL